MSDSCICKKNRTFLCETKFCCFFKLTSVYFFLFFLSLEELDGSLDETSDEYSDSGSEVEMKVTRTRKLEQPAPRVSFAFYPFNIDFPFI